MKPADERPRPVEVAPPTFASGGTARSPSSQVGGPAMLHGKARSSGRSGVVPYDADRGRAGMLGYTVEQEGCMSEEEAKDIVAWFFNFAGVSRSPDAVKHSVFMALCLDLGINGTSMQRPSRTTLHIDTVQKIPMENFLTKLGSNLRRFARFYATEIHTSMAFAYDSYDPDDSASSEVRAAIDRNANDLGLVQEPTYAFDVADYIIGIPPHILKKVSIAKLETLRFKEDTVSAESAFNYRRTE